MEINEKIQELRLSANMLQRELAKKIGVAEYVVSNWEQGRSAPSIDDLKKLCVIFDVTMDELLDMDNFSFKPLN